MNVTFDGPNKLCILGNDVSHFDVVELYSDWKAWMVQGDNAKYLPAFRSVGGDPLGSDTKIAPYYFLTEGWRVRPAEADIDLLIDGNLLTEEGDFPIVHTLGAFQVNVRMVTSSAATVVTVSGGSALTQQEHDYLLSIPSNTLTQEEHDKLMAIIADVGEMVVEGSLTLSQFLRIMMAALAGKTTGGGTSTVRFRDLADAMDRIVATVDANGNRTGITVDPS